MDRRDLLDADFVQVARGERALDGVRGAGAEVGLVGALGGWSVGALVSVGLVLAGETWVMLAGESTGGNALRDAGVQRADDADDVVVGRSLVAAYLPTSGVAWSSWASSSSVQPGMGGLVRLLDGQVDRVLDADAEGRQVAGQRGDDADLGDLCRSGFPARGLLSPAATCRHRKRRGQQGYPCKNQLMLSHISSWLFRFCEAAPSGNLASMSNLRLNLCNGANFAACGTFVTRLRALRCKYSIFSLRLRRAR